MPYGFWSGFRSLGLEVVRLGGDPTSRSPHFHLTSLAKRYGGPAVRGAGRRIWSSGTSAVRRFSKTSDYDIAISRARSSSQSVQESLKRESVDLVFGVCISTSLFDLNTNIPIVYTSDTTARLINNEYPEYSCRSSEYHRACDDIERSALSRCTHFVGACPPTVHSAIHDFGVPPERTTSIEFGANVTPSSILKNGGSPPHVGGPIELLLVASNARRKRLRFSIEVVENLRELGWNATLNYIGPSNRLASTSEFVRCWGRLDLASKSDRSLHRDLIASSHWLLQPSSAEAFGIAPCEAAHFGRPSVVADVGGLPTVVSHNESGIVMPQGANPREYACQIINCSSSDRYRHLADGALRRAHEYLNWETCCRRFIKIFNSIIDGRFSDSEPSHDRHGSARTLQRYH